MLIEAVLALPNRQILIELEVPDGSTVGDARARAEVHEAFRGLELSSYRTGVYGALCDAGRSLEEGDRLEFYRPLEVDAKERRRALARAQNPR
jgi:putative ubiquitin-RnfH superfamily antitoxin RatB of RatAB toxin-antitoxin module